jgi:predicted GNAT family acetyltransferase
MALPIPRHEDNTARALRFLERDAAANFHIASTLLHEPSRIVGLAESGEALIGVAIAGKSPAGRPGLLRLDAIGPVALRRLLATLHDRPTRVMLHRPWQDEVVAREIGPVRSQTEIIMYGATADDITGPGDPGVRVLTAGDVVAAQARSRSWVLDLLAEHLARGWQAFGAYAGEELAAHVCCGYQTGAGEEICHLFTTPEHRGRGLATAVVGGAARAILARGRQPFYFSRSANTASRRVAVRAGFHAMLSLREVAIGA